MDYDWKSHKFIEPHKAIYSPDDLETLKNSSFLKDYLGFITACQQSVKGKSISETQPKDKFKPFENYLSALETFIEETPPLEQKMRFGNKAFRTWYEKALTNSHEVLFSQILNENTKGAAVELQKYLKDSFGSFERIDYGTGHELAFKMFLLCLFKLGLYGVEDLEQLVRQVFYKYIKLMRKLQLTYKLEPAGSHGVWGLDDYHFLPFLYGASELVGNSIAKTPDAIHNEVVLNQLKNDYMYLECIAFIKEVKKGSLFSENSPMLNDISAVLNWEKVASGMVKMYQAEVLFKLPVAKHIHFGSLIPFN